MKAKKGFWNKVELVLNKTPHLSIMLLIGVVIVAITSGILASYLDTISYTFIDPETFEKSKVTLKMVNYLDIDNIAIFLARTVENFGSFDTLYLVVFTLFAFGVSERSGFLYVSLKGLLKKVPNIIVTVLLVTIAMLSSIASSDYLSGSYIILLPLAAFIFMGTDRNPLAGIATVLASIFGGYAISIIHTGSLDQISTITNVQLNYTLITGINSDFYIQLAMGVIFVITTTFITHNVIENILPPFNAHLYTFEKLTIPERKGVIAAGITTMFFILIYFYFLLPPHLSTLPGFGALIGDYDPVVQSYIDKFFESIFIEGIAIHIAIYLIIVSSVFGLVSHKFSNFQDIIKSMIDAIANHAEYFIFVFALSLFITILYDSGVALFIIQGLNNFVITYSFDTISLVVFTFIASFVGTFFVPLPALRWGIAAPVIIPLFTAFSLNPAFGQTIFSMGGSASSFISIVMPYTIFAFVLFDAYAIKTNQNCGNGTYVKLTYPYALAYAVVFGLLFIIWLVLSIPLSNTLPVIF